MKINETYPVVIIPEAIRRACVFLPEPKYSQPIRPARTRPEKPNPGPQPQPVPNHLIWGWGAIAFFLSLIVGVFIGSFDSLIGWCVGFSMFGFGIKLSFQNYNQEKIKYQQKLRDYQRKFKQVEAYPRKLARWKDYKKNTEPKLLQQYDKELKFYEDERAKRQQILEKGKNNFKRIRVGIPTQGTSQKGYSESFLGQYLNSYFPGKIYTELVLTQYINYPYAPDFIYCDPNWNLYIDIEIDEPYNYKDKQPTHFIGLDKERIRNEFFVENNWVVIRFAEEQVVKEPRSCCRFIAEKLNLLIAQPIPEQLKSETTLKEVKRWDYEKAKKMAAEDYRHFYLK